MEIQCRLILINEKFKASAICRFVLQHIHPSNKMNYSKSTAGDLLFSLSTGSIGFICCNDFDANIKEELKKVEASFRRSYAIFVGIEESLWIKALVEVQGGNLNLLLVQTDEEGADLIVRIVQSFSDQRRTSFQEEYFERERESLLKGSVARRIFLKILLDENFIGLQSENEAYVLLSSFSSIGQFLSVASKAEIIEQVIMNAIGRIESDTVRKIQSFLFPTLLPSR